VSVSGAGRRTDGCAMPWMRRDVVTWTEALERRGAVTD
jgi:hypothetical protein